MKELDLAVRAAEEGGRLAAERLTQGVRAEWKASRDLVTEADRASQARITQLIAEVFPADAVVGEEGSPPAEEVVAGTRRWYVDPIDGTTNFLKGRPWWGVSVAFCDADDDITAGAVYLPVLEQMYAAAAGHGATRNGRPIRCSGVTDLEQALCASGFPTSESAVAASESNLAAWHDLLRRVMSLRVTGAVAPDWASVASGETDGAWAVSVGRWDIAAGALIAREAGARVTDLAGGALRGPATAGLVAAPGIHAQLLEIVAGALARGDDDA